MAQVAPFVGAGLIRLRVEGGCESALELRAAKGFHRHLQRLAAMERYKFGWVNGSGPGGRAVAAAGPPQTPRAAGTDVSLRCSAQSMTRLRRTLPLMGSALATGKRIGIGAAAVVVGTGAAVVGLAVLALVILWMTSKSPTEKALHGVRATVTNGSPVGVRSCAKVQSNADFDVFRCAIVAPQCHRTYLFGVDKSASVYNIELYTKSQDVLSKPCAYPSDRRLLGERPA